MPINPVPEPTPAAKLEAALNKVERRLAGMGGWYLSGFLLGVIVGYIIGVW